MQPNHKNNKSNNNNNAMHQTTDVKTVYFSEPVTGLPKPVFYRLPKGLLWAG